MTTKKNIKNTLILTLVFAGFSVLTACNQGQRLTFPLANNPLPGPMKGSILKKSQRFNR